MDKQVYHALKGIFKGQTARKKKTTIRKIISQHIHDDQVKMLLQSHTLEDVCNSVQGLLDDHIFGSEQKAQARFSKAIVTIPDASSITVSPSAAVAAGNKQSVIFRDRVNTGKDGNQQCMLGAEQVPTVSKQDKKSLADTDAPATALKQPKFSKAMLNISYEAQYHLLVYTQRLLENACFDFALASFPDILHKNAWDCPAAIELNLFIKELGERKALGLHNPKTITQLLKGSFLSSISDIRHDAVHRHRLSSNDIDGMLEKAVQFLNGICDNQRAEWLERLWRDVQKTLLQLDIEEKDVDAALEKKRKKIESRKLELNRLEEAALRDAELSRKSFRGSAAFRIDHAIDIAHSATGASRDRSPGVKEATAVMVGHLLFLLHTLWNVLWASVGFLVGGAVALMVFVWKHLT